MIDMRDIETRLRNLAKYEPTQDEEDAIEREDRAYVRERGLSYWTDGREKFMNDPTPEKVEAAKKVHGLEERLEKLGKKQAGEDGSILCDRCGFDGGDNSDGYVSRCCDLLPANSDRSYVDRLICGKCHEALLGMGGERPPSDVEAAYNRGDRAPFNAWFSNHVDKSMIERLEKLLKTFDDGAGVDPLEQCKRCGNPTTEEENHLCLDCWTAANKDTRFGLAHPTRRPIIDPHATDISDEDKMRWKAMDERLALLTKAKHYDFPWDDVLKTEGMHETVIGKLLVRARLARDGGKPQADFKANHTPYVHHEEDGDYHIPVPEDVLDAIYHASRHLKPNDDGRYDGWERAWNEINPSRKSSFSARQEPFRNPSEVFEDFGIDPGAQWIKDTACKRCGLNPKSIGDVCEDCHVRKSLDGRLEVLKGRIPLGGPGNYDETEHPDFTGAMAKTRDGRITQAVEDAKAKIRTNPFVGKPTTAKAGRGVAGRIAAESQGSRHLHVADHWVLSYQLNPPITDPAHAKKLKGIHYRWFGKHKEFAPDSS